jgi:putative membrane protein
MSRPLKSGGAAFRRNNVKPAVLALASAFALSITPCFAQEGAGPTDPEIAQIVVIANQVDIDAGRLASSKASSDDVRKFAQLMITDHTGVNRQAQDLVARLKVTPAPSDTSKALKQGGDKNLSALRRLSGTQFDRAYVDHEVAYHQQVIDAIEDTLIPHAQNPELKALLVKVRPAFMAHLAHAQQMQASLQVQP